MSELDAPFPWFGGKSRIANKVWQRFGRIANYVEPFFGSGAVLLGRPKPIDGIETVNDLDGFVCNFWRSVQMSADATAEWADHPVNENDLHARHAWLAGQRESLHERLEGDPEFYDPKIAGWWVWGISCWIGGGFCSGAGPWHVVEGRLVRDKASDGEGVNRQRVHLGNAGEGVNRQRVHLGNAGQGVGSSRLIPWFRALAARLARVRVCSGDWSRVCGPSPTFKHGLTAVFLDPPYSEEAGRDPHIYREDNLDVAHAVREWAIENGANPLLRIALCGYEGEHNMPPTWQVEAWKATGGYASLGDGSNENSRRERIWYSPACLGVAQGSMF